MKKQKVVDNKINSISKLDEKIASCTACLKNKFDAADRENISHMIFVPIENDEGGLKSFFIGLSSN